MVAAVAIGGTGCRQILGFEGVAPAGEDAAGDSSQLLDGPADAPADVDPTIWTKRKQLTIDGDQVAGSLTSFPVLVRLAGDPDLAAFARPDGFDLLFTAADGTTKLAHEIERFDPLTGALIAWVNVPSLKSNTNTQLFLYFGNAGSPDQQSAAAVWDTGYVGVWHLGETAGTAVADSTSFARTGTKVAATTPAPVSGMIGGGQSFAGGADGISIGNAQILDISDITLELWINVPVCQTDVFRRIIDFTLDFQFSWALAYPCAGATQGNDNTLVLDLPNDHLQTPTNSLSAGIDHHVVFMSNPTQVFITQRTTSGTAVLLAQDNVNTIIGNRENSVDRAMIGTLDEVRISRVNRSAAYTTTTFNNQRAGSTFLTLGALEDVP